MNVVIVEDSSEIREKLKFLLRHEKDLSLTGWHENAEDALRNLENDRPNVMLVDLGLPKMTGIEMIWKVKEQCPAVEIVVYTVHEDKEVVFSALKAGATGFLTKDSSAREIVDALLRVYKGDAPMSPRIARSIINEFKAAAQRDTETLTGREKEVLSDIGFGLNYKEVGEKYKISEHTVHAHVKKIYSKLHAKNRGEALTKARQKGLI